MEDMSAYQIAAIIGVGLVIFGAIGFSVYKNIKFNRDKRKYPTPKPGYPTPEHKDKVPEDMKDDIIKN